VPAGKLHIYRTGVIRALCEQLRGAAEPKGVRKRTYNPSVSSLPRPVTRQQTARTTPCVCALTREEEDSGQRHGGNEKTKHFPEAHSLSPAMT
jgi:hypothetical protein